MADEDLSRLKIDKSKISFRSKRRRTIVYPVLGLILLVAFGLLYTQGIFSPSVQVQAATITQVYPSQGFTLLNASGYVVAQRKSALASKVTGRLIWLGVEEGSFVKKDQVVARLESDDVEAAKHQAEANVNVARHGLEQAKAELDNASISFKRNQELVKRGVVSRSVYDDALARYEKAEASVAAAEATLKSNVAALRAASVLLEYTEIRAPFDAVVLTKNADIGDIVTPLGAAANAKAAVVTIADMNSLEVEVDVSEANLNQIRPGQPCEIQLDALPGQRFHGSVHMLVPTADRSKATVMVKVRFDEKDKRILPEMSAKVAFLSRIVKAQEEKPRTAVNRSALISRKGQNSVFVIQQGRAEEVPVTIGEPIGDMIEVQSGVKPGDQVVLNPSSKLKDGAKIKIVEK